MIRLSMITVVCLGAISCGYHTGGRAETIPKNIRTVAIPTFTNLFTSRYILGDKLPEQIAREFSARTHFVVVSDPAQADAVLRGSVNSAFGVPTIYDPGSGKATSVGLNVNLTIRLVNQHTGKILFSRVNWNVREDYELAVDPHQFFNESGPAQDRLSRDVARDVVSAIVEDF